ncbi:lysylphosphatidylglycerol synthase transmembrane domain-containing protein [Kiritimatiellaeota bacterium B1221]|nr:lysylphosphatidylglycerol synthase transmembrane domain-containing protein [Kiritimatiellaeota bacterium B1221]
MSSKKSQLKKRITLFAKCLISLVFLGILFVSVDPQKLKEQFSQINPWFAVAGVGLSFVMVGASTWKWWLLLRIQNCPLPFLDLYRWYFVGYFYSNFLPSNVGGDVARAWLAGKKANSHSTVLISIFAERFTGLIFMLLLAVILPFTQPELLKLPAVWMGSCVAACGLLMIGLLMAFGVKASKMKVVQGLLGFAQKILRADRPGKTRKIWTQVASKLEVLSEKLGELFVVLRQRPVALLHVILLTALYYVLAVGNVLLAYRAFGVWADPAGIAAVLPVALMVAMIPVGLGSWGIAEGAYVYYFGLVGLGKDLTLAMGIFLRMKILLLGLVGLVVNLKEPAQPES